MRQVTKHGLASIPDPKVRSCLYRRQCYSHGKWCSVVCSGMGWEQKAVVCMQSIGIYAGVATGMYEGPPDDTW